MTNTNNNTPANETTREDIPLKSGTKLSKWYHCNEECLGGSRFINAAFGTLTVIITIALLIQIYYGDYQVVPHGSVATDNIECSHIGTQILKKGGNARDAAIASAFCLSVVAQHLTSLDAEGQIMIYNHRKRDLPIVIDFSSPNVLSDKMPKLVVGLAYIHKLYGSMSWKSLVEPSVQIARRGHKISNGFLKAMDQAKAHALFGRIDPDKPLKNENLAITLETIANITEKELYGYIDPAHQPIQMQAIKSSFHNYDVFVPASETIGSVLLVNLREIEEYNFTKVNTEAVKRILDSTLKTYNEFKVTSRFHEGTSTNIAVMDMEDNYVSLVIGLYELFGSGELTSHGYVLDVKNKEKSCSRIPIILTDNKFICGKRMAFGANGIAQGSQIVSNLVIGDKNVTDGIEAPRFYVLDGNTVAVEVSHTPKFSIEILRHLNETHTKSEVKPEPYYSSNVVAKYQDDLSSHSDSRGEGVASRF
ncbi:glutathione hydrolase 7-like [Anthonomus grandis grandis]|uniref:glutathione hydrolase 7-like n=1 Tax=Anthonomus grandis grandis TaxID=2921223 RepID=UPI002165F8A3|nr:glutathione hydrolase 7-like [Anthonomus grandis grandis]